MRFSSVRRIGVVVVVVEACRIFVGTGVLPRRANAMGAEAMGT